MNLAQIEPGKTAVITNLHVEGAMERRLRDLGFVEGVEITCVGRSPLGDPSAYLIMGGVFALRQRDCMQIEVRGCGHHG